MCPVHVALRPYDGRLGVRNSSLIYRLPHPHKEVSGPSFPLGPMLYDTLRNRATTSAHGPQKAALTYAWQLPCLPSSDHYRFLEAMENAVALMVCMYTGPLLWLNNTLRQTF